MPRPRLALLAAIALAVIVSLAALARSLTDEHIAVEVAYLTGEGRGTFERPYGLAWLLQLAAELRSQVLGEKEREAAKARIEKEREKRGLRPPHHLIEVAGACRDAARHVLSPAAAFSMKFPSSTSAPMTVLY